MPGHGLQNLCGSADDLQGGISHQGLRYPGPDASFEAALRQSHMATRAGTPVTSWSQCSWLEDLFEEDEECTGRTLLEVTLSQAKVAAQTPLPQGARSHSTGPALTPAGEAEAGPDPIMGWPQGSSTSKI